MLADAARATALRESWRRSLLAAGATMGNTHEVGISFSTGRSRRSLVMISSASRLSIVAASSLRIAAGYRVPAVIWCDCWGWVEDVSGRGLVDVTARASPRAPCRAVPGPGWLLALPMTTTRITARPSGRSVSRWRCSKGRATACRAPRARRRPGPSVPRSSLHRRELVVELASPRPCAETI